MENETWCEKIEEECREDIALYGEKIFSLPYEATAHGKIDKLESVMINYPLLDLGEPEHLFVDRMYIRCVKVPAGTLFTSLIHMTNNPLFIMKGRVVMYSEIDGEQELESPYIGLTQIGTRRVFLVHEDCVLATCHLNLDNCRDIDVIEARIFDQRENPLLGGFMKKNVLIKKIN
jgi:hypothetical protein